MPNAKRVHFVGVCGAALSGLAQLLVSRGGSVSGSDLKGEGEMADRLRAAGVVVHKGHSADHITADIDQVIISSAAVAGPGAVEIERARELGIPVYKRTELWRQLTGQAKIAIAVAGSHGKTSTTAMIGVVLTAAGLNPTVLVGGDVPDFNGNVRVGSPDVIVIEADEYDRAFLSLRPTVGVILNIDYDHPDTYPTPVAYAAAFRRFARKVTDRGGRVVMNGRDASLRKTFSRWKRAIAWFDPTKSWPGVHVQTPGEHMRQNALAAAKAADLVGVPAKVIHKALADFKGVKRRFEYIGTLSGLKIYDDFAHHPTEMAANITTAKQSWGKVAVIFQPHQAIRTKVFATDFARVLDEADRVGIVPLYTVAGREGAEKTTEAEITKHMKTSYIILTKDEDIANYIAECQKGGFTSILMMGAGDASDRVRSMIKP